MEPRTDCGSAGRWVVSVDVLLPATCYLRTVRICSAASAALPAGTRLFVGALVRFACLSFLAVLLSGWVSGATQSNAVPLRYRRYGNVKRGSVHSLPGIQYAELKALRRRQRMYNDGAARFSTGLPMP